MKYFRSKEQREALMKLLRSLDWGDRNLHPEDAGSNCWVYVQLIRHFFGNDVDWTNVCKVFWHLSYPDDYDFDCLDELCYPAPCMMAACMRGVIDRDEVLREGWCSVEAEAFRKLRGEFVEASDVGAEYRRDHAKRTLELLKSPKLDLPPPTVLDPATQPPRQNDSTTMEDAGPHR